MINIAFGGNTLQIRINPKKLLPIPDLHIIDLGTLL